MNLNDDVIVGLPSAVQASELKEFEQEIFISKLGGYPIWPKLDDIPCPLCSSCQKNMKFLFQIYAPLDYDYTYHRGLFLYICMSESCKNKPESLKVFRMQLPETYEFEPADIVSKLREFPKDIVLSESVYEIVTENVTGDEQSKLLKKWEEDDKKPGFADDDDDLKSEDFEDDSSNETFDSKKSEDYSHENQLLKQYLEKKNNPEESKQDNDDKEYDEIIAQMRKKREDKDFEKYRVMISTSPSQILRYCRGEGSQPLFISSQAQPSVSSVKKCENCGEKRVFEMQITPQILNAYKELIMLDWGVLLIYCCSKSCPLKGFGEEVVYLQLNQEESHINQKAVSEIQLQIKKDREAGLLAQLPEHEESSESNDEEAITQDNEDSQKKKKRKKAKKKKEPVIQAKTEENNPDQVADDWA